MSEKFHLPFVIIRLADMACWHGLSGCVKTGITIFTKYFYIFQNLLKKDKIAFHFMMLRDKNLSHISVT
ncbi:hypothetical protein AZ09_01015 [Acetobacter aceti 1023]|nr:hypothetical protein AZ09_01015 [Acetobacter aceti 1023]